MRLKAMRIYTEIIHALERKEPVVLATIIHRMGSAPREAGAKFLVKKDGSCVGSIGGGCVEAEVWQKAQKVMQTGAGSVLHFNLTAEQLADGGLICGGNIHVFLEPLREGFLEIYREIERLRQQGGSGILATVISVNGEYPRGEAVKVFIKPSGEKTGSLFLGEDLEQKIFKEAERFIRAKRVGVMKIGAEAGHRWKDLEILLEPIIAEPTVYIFGAGHISQQLAPLVKRVHFKVVVIDDRAMFANRDLFPEADEVMVTEFERVFDQIQINEFSYVIIVTRGHLYDGMILEKALQTDACYIGMIGSKKKIQILYKNLVEKGVSKVALERVHAPIGLDIGSETPEEIAISIVAQLIMKRRGRLA